MAAEAATSGVEAAFRTHYAQVLRFFTRRMRDRAQAEDLAQDVFLAAVAAVGDLPPEVPVGAWLYLVAARRLVDYRRRKRGQRSGASLVEETAASDGVGAAEVARSLRLALTHLPVEQREVLVLHLLRGYGLADVAALLGLREEAAKKRWQRGMVTLRRELAEQQRFAS